MVQKFDTLAVHAGAEPDRETGAVAPPLHFSTTFVHAPPGETDDFSYQRAGNPTQRRLETALAALEGGERALAYASGMAAVAAVLDTLQPGQRLVVPEDCYVGTRGYVTEVLPERGIDVATVDTTDLDAVRAACQPGVALLWAESPSNPRLRVSDLAELAEIAHAGGGRFACDNTFATPVLQRPLELGADIVMHSTTKYFGGHSDVLGGALVFAKNDDFAERIAARRLLTGAILAPFSAWLTLRGCRSLPARMAMHCANARKVAAFLAKHSAIERVNWPGLPEHPGHVLAQRQMRDFGAMLSVELHGGYDAAVRLTRGTKIFINATSLGGCESLIEHRASAEGAHSHSPPGLVRLSIGLEDALDLVDDLDQALR
ncbi:MAG TPA: aminotransferase class I/II-fold pyridoxal phosphate-dependent enzyme [Rhodanobacteraceae bacterium]|jgi:cystathionine gamma-synthase|nr:aminotransferase class I/II-fold pyridoxal phosphate-dependent enzyme [Rhodanobacteraceae bacterium]